MLSLEELIEEVRKHDCLWNKNLETYRNKNTRDNAWESISIDLEKPVENLKHEWKKLQDCYRQAMMRRRTNSEHFAKKNKPWKYEELMSFLASDTLSTSTQFKFDTYEDSAGNSDSVEQIAENIKLEENWQDDDQSSNEPKCPNQSNKKLSGELDYFFASACESTKRLPRLLQIRVKQEIMNSITNAEIEYINSMAQSSSR